MAQQGKQMRVGARKGFAYHSVKLKGFAYHSVKLVLLANGNMNEVDSIHFLYIVKPFIHLRYALPQLWPFFDTHSYA